MSRLVWCAAVAALLSVWLVPAAAFAAWPLEHAGAVELAYGAPFADGARTHRGLDLSARQDDRVLAPADGTVTFAGRVPASGGGSTLAVSLRTPDGLTVTLMPLESVAVNAGAALGAGAAVGELAAAGDESLAQAHLHLSVRRGDAYLDPASVLDLAQATPPAAQPDPAHGAAPAPAPAPASATGPATGLALAPGVALATAAGASAPAATPAGAGVVTVARPDVPTPAGAALGVGVALASGAPAPAPGLAPAAAAPGGAGAALGRAGAWVARQAIEAAGRQQWGLIASVCALALTLLVGAVWCLRRATRFVIAWIIRRVRVRPEGEDVAAVAGRC